MGRRFQKGMPGEILTCLWQAAYACDVTNENQVTYDVLWQVTEPLLPLLGCGKFDFEAEFKNKDISFSKYKKFLVTNRYYDTPSNQFSLCIEEKCWDTCKDAGLCYTDKLQQSDIKKLWMTFNRLGKAASYPPVANKDDCVWFFRFVAKEVNVSLQNMEACSANELTYQEFHTTLNKHLFVHLTEEQIHSSVSHLFDWLVSEVIKSGWISKRTRKQSNWTGWQKRWAVLTPTKLTYFESENSNTKKGDIFLDENTEVESLNDLQSFRKKRAARFKLTNARVVEMEATAENEKEKAEWLLGLRSCVSSAKENLTPVTKLLLERAEMQAKRESTENADKQLAEMCNSIKPKQNMGQTRKMSEDNRSMQDICEEQRKKIQGVFFQMDVNGNGYICATEFKMFIEKLGLKMDDREIQLLFQSISKKDSQHISFDEFYTFFVNFVIGDSRNASLEAKLRAAFLEADRKGEGKINYKEFAEFALTRKQQLTLRKVAKVFDRADQDMTGDIDFKEFRKFFRDTSMLFPLPEDEEIEEGASKLNRHFESFYNKQDADDIAEYLRNRWKLYVSFRRTGADGGVVMKGNSKKMVADFLPGEYSLLQLACFNDLPPLEPAHAVIKGVEWLTSSIPGKSGRALFPGDFDGRIPSEIATNEFLAYYDCSLASGSSQKVSLLYRHGIQDFTYENDYIDQFVLDPKRGVGGGIEKHAFAHLDCPLEDVSSSGHFLIGKMVDDELHLTAFRVPKQHAVFVPPNVIHSNDYLRGTWRTMLSDEAEIDHVSIVRATRDGLKETQEHFLFQFYES